MTNENKYVKHVGILFNRKSGKVIQQLEEQYGSGMLKMFGMSKVSATRDFVIINCVSGVVEGYFEGRKDSMPKIRKDLIGMSASEFGISAEQL